MFQIKVKIDHVNSANMLLKSQYREVASSGSVVSNMKFQIAPAILSRSGIRTRMNSAIMAINDVEMRIKRLERMIDSSMLLYGKTEEALGRRASNMEKPNSTSANDSAHGGKGNSNGNPIRSYNDFGKYVITGQSIIGASLVLGKQIQFSQKGKNTQRAVIHTAQWMKGKGSNELLKKFARTMDKSIRNPGPIMKTIMGVDRFMDKYGRTKILGLSEAKSFQHWLKNVTVGVNDGTHGIKTSKIPGMIAKRIYPLDAVLNIGEEAWMLAGEHKRNDLDKTDWVVAGSNVVIKTASTAAGAFVGGILGMVGGPPGAAAGAFIGGGAGAWVGDALAGFSEKIIRQGPGEVLKETGQNISNSVKKGFGWLKDKFK